MTIKNKLNSAWQTNKVMDAVFEFRAQAENAYNVLQEVVARIDEIVANTDFSGVDKEILDEGGAIRNILKQSKDELDKHSDFIEWRQNK